MAAPERPPAPVNHADAIESLPRPDGEELFEQLHSLRYPLHFDQAHDLSAQLVLDQEWAWIQSWMSYIDRQEMQYCNRCKERWFDVWSDNDGVCQRCHARDRNANGVFLMSLENCMDPGDVPSFLPSLTDIEEMLIAPVHISMYMIHVKGAQYRYKGHVMTFLRDLPDVVNVLPRLPSSCNVVLIRPKQALGQDSADAVSTRQFRRSFTVQRWKVQARISFLMSVSYFQKEIANSTFRLG